MPSWESHRTGEKPLPKTFPTQDPTWPLRSNFYSSYKAFSGKDSLTNLGEHWLLPLPHPNPTLPTTTTTGIGGALIQLCPYQSNPRAPVVSCSNLTPHAPLSPHPGGKGLEN